MEVITIETQAFYTLIEQVVKRIKAEQKITEDKWVSPSDAMKMLKISSPTTLSKWRNEGKLRFTSPTKKIILYETKSIHEFLEKHSHETF